MSTFFVGGKDLWRIERFERCFVEVVVLQCYLTNICAQTEDQVSFKSLLCPKFPEKCFIWRSRQANSSTIRCQTGVVENLSLYCRFVIFLSFYLILF